MVLLSFDCKFCSPVAHLLYHFTLPSFSSPIYPSSSPSWLPQVFQQLSQHALLSPCGSDQTPLSRYKAPELLERHLLFYLLSVSPHFLFFLHSALFTAPVSSSFSAPCGPDVWGMFTSPPRPRALSVMAVRPELDALYRKINEQSSGEGPGNVCDQLLFKLLVQSSHFRLGS